MSRINQSTALHIKICEAKHDTPHRRDMHFMMEHKYNYLSTAHWGSCTWVFPLFRTLTLLRYSRILIILQILIIKTK